LYNISIVQSIDYIHQPVKMSAQIEQNVPEFVQTYPGVSGTKTVFACAGLAGGWYLHKTMIPDIGKDGVCQ
jgi:hypothetical protein